MYLRAQKRQKGEGMDLFEVIMGWKGLEKAYERSELEGIDLKEDI